MPLLPRRTSDIAEAIGRTEWLALHVNETQELASTLLEALEGRLDIAPEFLEALTQVASYEVQL